MKRTILLISAVLAAALLFVSCESDNTKFYTVTFNSNGGTAVKSQEVVADGYAVEPKSPEKNGYVFLEWQKSGEKFDFGSTHITGNITLDAVWEAEKPKSYKVTFSSNGGSAVKSQEVMADGYAVEPKSPEKEGYIFLEWQKAGREFDFGSTRITSDITLCAVWIKEDYTVKFNPGEGTIDGSSESLVTKVKYNSTAQKPSDPVRTGYTFQGWYCGEDPFDFNIKITNDLVLTAKWQAVNTYTVVFRTTYGAAVQTQTVVDGDKAVKPEDPEDEGGGGTFVEWTKEDGNTYNFDTPVTGNIILYAKWEKNGSSTSVNFYDVSFEYEDGSYIYGTTVEAGHKVVPADPVSRDRHKIFDYWVKKGETTPVDPGKNPVTGDVTFVAVWRDLKKGDRGPAGGIIFYDAGEVKTGIYHDEFGNTVSYLWRYLEAAPADVDDYYVFGYYRYNDNDANMEVGTGINLGEGRLNTASLVTKMLNPVYEEAGGSNKSVSIAVKCRDYSLTNAASAKEYRGWFLPSMSELDAMYEMKDVLGMDGEYWSSSEYDWDYAYYMDFKTGLIDLIPRYGYATARPVRAF